MIFDLLFLAVVLATLATLAAVLVAALRGRFRRAGKLFLGLVAGFAVYLAAVVVVSWTTPQRVLALAEDHCFDDWCIAVDDVEIASELGPPESTVQADGAFYVLTLRLSNHARGRPQRASSTAVYLVGAAGQRYDVSARGLAAFEAEHGAVLPLTATIPVGGSLVTHLVFDLPEDARDVGAIVQHPVGTGPGLFVIGDEGSLFHERAVVRLGR